MAITNKDLIQCYIMTTAKYDFNVYEKKRLSGCDPKTPHCRNIRKKHTKDCVGYVTNRKHSEKQK